MKPTGMERLKKIAALLLPVVAQNHAAPAADEHAVWRITNGAAVDVVWRVKSLQFFSDDECSRPLNAAPNITGDAFASAASDMTDAVHVFALRSMRGWESAGHCAERECHVGFSWWQSSTSDDKEKTSHDASVVRCLLISQGETGLHAGSIILQKKQSGNWEDVMTWNDLEGGKLKLAMSCPAVPQLQNGQVAACQEKNERDKECPVTCNNGFGTVEPRMRCIHGAWFVPECLGVGTMVRLVAQAPELIKPYWVVLDVSLYRNADCTDVIRMDGRPISSGEFVIKYASYHPSNAWDGDSQTSWASSQPCTPGSCYIGYRFPQAPDEVRCARVEHPAGKQYHATSVVVEKLGSNGWEQVPDVTMRLLPEDRGQEL